MLYKKNCYDKILLQGEIYFLFIMEDVYEDNIRTFDQGIRKQEGWT